MSETVFHERFDSDARPMSLRLTCGACGGQINRHEDEHKQWAFRRPDGSLWVGVRMLHARCAEKLDPKAYVPDEAERIELARGGP